MNIFDSNVIISINSDLLDSIVYITIMVDTKKINLTNYFLSCIIT